MDIHGRAVAPEKAEHQEQRPRRRASLRPLLTFFGVLGIAIAAIIVAGLLPRLRREQTLAATAESQREQLPIVNVTAVKPPAGNAPLELPGDLQAMVESPIFARADGYLIKRYADVGDRVKAGQVLAEIETPELDQQLEQSRATLANSKSAMQELRADLALAEANQQLSQTTAQRWEQLEKKGAISHQDADEKRADAKVKQAQVDAAHGKLRSAEDLIHANEASVRRLEQLKSFSKVTAPFTGIITARNVDVGTLINSGNGGSAKELFRIAQQGTMRIFVNVPQAYVGSVREGQKADLSVQELPGQIFPAVVTRFSHAVDEKNRSMLAILEVPNPQGVLLPGMYSTVRFAAMKTGGGVLIPGDALVLGSKGARVAVAQNGVVHFRDIKVGNDYGGEVEILSGLQPGELVIMNPTDAVRDDARVEVHKVSEK